MLSVAHGPTGALIASKIPNPFISIPLCILAHFIEDYIPHWDTGQGLTKKKKSKKAAFLQELLIDFPLSIVIVFFLFQYGQPFSWIIWAGWFAALAPDFIEFPHLFLGWKFWPISQITKIHNAIHRSTPDKLRGLLPQIVVILVIFLLR